jgi:CheY-like chemotaxis protein
MKAASSRSLLIIEDDPDLRMTLEYFLGKIGYQVLTARDGEEGLRMCLETRPKAVICDIMLPGMDGYDTCSRIKGDPITRDIAVIFITAKKASEVLSKGSKACADFWIPKPVDPNDVGADLYLLFEKSFDLAPDELKQLRVTKQVPRLTGSTMTAYQIAGMEPTGVHFADTHTHTSSDLYKSGPVHSPPPASASPPERPAPRPPQPTAPAPAPTGSEIQKIQSLLVALKDSLKDTGARLDAVLQYIDMIDR